jgi:HAE1 family hydrophobic/amphiphilic exporter-1
MKLLRKIILEHPAGSLVACLCLAITGFVASQRMQISLNPSVRLPVLTVSTELSGVEPEEIELLITRKIERAMSDISGIKEIESVSREGESEVVLRFHLGSDVSTAALEVRSRIRRLFSTFPKDTRFPVISFFDPSSAPLALLGVTGGRSLAVTAKWAREVVKPNLDRIKGVAAVKIAGAPITEIAVDCDSGRLRALGLTISDVTEIIHRAHKTLSGGHILKGKKRLAVRTTGKLSTPVQIARLPLHTTQHGNTVTIGDVAKVALIEDMPREISRLNGQPLVSVAIFRATGADQRNLWKTVRKKLDEMEASAPSGIEIQEIYSQAEELQKILDRLKQIMMLSAVAAGFVVFLFMRSVASPLIILSAIPFSLSVAILLMYLLNLEFDLLSLTGLVLAAGILIDNGIVVVESIVRRLSSHPGNTPAVVEAVEEVSQPVLYSTLTTIMVFFPLVFVSPEIRIYYVGLTWSVSLSLLASLGGALILVPELFHFFGRKTYLPRHQSDESRSVSTIYEQLLRVTLDHPLVVFSLTVAIVAAAAAIVPKLSFGTGASTGEENIWINFVMPPGTGNDLTDAEARSVEQLVLGIPQVKSVYSRVWGNQARLLVTLKDNLEDTQSVETVMSTLEKKIGNREPAEFHLQVAGQGGTDRILSLNIIGPSLDKLVQYQRNVRHELSKISGIRDVIIRQGNPVPRQEFILRHDRLGFYGVSARDFADTLRGQLTGPVATRVLRDDTETLVRVRAFRKDAKDLTPLSGAFLQSDNGQLIPLTELSRPTFRMAPSELHRKNRARVLRIQLLLSSGDDALRLSRDVSAAVDRIEFDEGYKYQLGDEIDRIIDTHKEMMTATLLAILLTYLVLTASTESFLQPLVVMTSIPCAAAGVAVASFVVGFPITRPVYMAMIILCGIVINVNILIIYAINARIAEGDPPETAVKRGALRRLRPLMITTLTTVAGSVPMLLDTGQGSSLWNPFAITLAAGLTSASAVSLVLTPPLYLCMLRAESRVHFWLSRARFGK